MHADAFMLEAEDPIIRPAADTTHCAPLSAIFGSALGPLTDANLDVL